MWTLALGVGAEPGVQAAEASASGTEPPRTARRQLWARARDRCPEDAALAVGGGTDRCVGSSPGRRRSALPRYQIAQKLHAVTEQPPDRPNLRFWDRIDLILLGPLLGDDVATVRDAAAAIFEARGTHAWPPQLVVPEAWREPYAASAAEIGAGLPASVDEAAARVRALIDAIEVSNRISDSADL